MHVETLFLASIDILGCLYVIVELFFTISWRCHYNQCLFDRRDTLLIISIFYKTTCNDTLLYLYPLCALKNIKKI
jgi:hypothetical protein